MTFGGLYRRLEFQHFPQEPDACDFEITSEGDESDRRLSRERLRRTSADQFSLRDWYGSQNGNCGQKTRNWNSFHTSIGKTTRAIVARAGITPKVDRAGDLNAIIRAVMTSRWD